jgi:hypothetical protein
MDRRRARTRALIAFAALALAGAADSPKLPIREARWIAPGALYSALSSEPPECLAVPRDPSSARSVAIGRAAFRAPLLLGGQAARLGMSCATCHRNGRGNPDFLFPGLSGAPGTADVTISLMSSHRGDGIANPRPIPDLGGPRSALKIPRDPKRRELERFIRGLVVEEFDGPEPSAELLAGLGAYVRALTPDACRGASRPITLASRLADVDSALDAARRSGGETRRLLVAAARSALGAIDERFTVPGLEGDRALLRDSGALLGAIREGRSGFEAWDRSWPARRRQLLRDSRRSLFEPAVLRRALAARG